MGSGIGRAVLARLGITPKREGGGEAFVPCQQESCQSSDACHVNLEDGKWKCFSCGEGGGPYKLALPVLGKDATIDLMIELGVMQPRKSQREQTGEHFDAVKTMARVKGCEAVSLEAYGASSPEGKSIVFFPMFSPAGEPCSHFRVDVLASSGDEEKDALLKKGLTSKGRPAGVFLPIQAGTRDTARLPAPGEKWCIVEGVKDAAALHALGFNALGTCGVYLQPKFAKLLKTVDVTIIPDRDTPSINGAQRTASGLYGLAESIRIATLPVEARASGGLDVRDVLRSKGPEAVLEAIAQAELWEPRDHGQDGRDRICTKAYELGVDPLQLTQAAIRALQRKNDPPRIFDRSGQVMRIEIGERSRLREVGSKELSCELLEAAAFYEDRGEKGESAVPPPKVVIDAILGSDHAGWPELEGLVTGPIVKPSGEVWAAAGYDKETRLVRPKGLDVQVPENPTHADALAARARLWRPFEDFPFEDQDSEANALALLLTPFLRHAYRGPTPLAAVTSPEPGSGKSKLLDLAGLLHSGEMPKKIRMGRNEELDKQISQALIAGSPWIVIDDASGHVHSEALQQALTAQVFSGRILGRNDVGFEASNLAVWALTGNNVDFGSEMRRRSYMIELSQSRAKRREFKIPRVNEWVLEHRAELCRDALTICRAWFEAGKPAAPNLPAMGSFEGWIDTVGAVVRWVGGTVLGNRERFERKHDTEQRGWRAFLEAIDDVDERFSITGLTAAQIQDHVDTYRLWDIVPERLERFVDRPNGFGQALSSVLRKREGRTHGEDGMRVVCIEGGYRGKQNLWKLEMDVAGADLGEGAIGGEDELPF